MTPDAIIEQLGLQPLPDEGGYFVETHRSSFAVPGEVLPDGYDGGRRMATAIYYLLTADTFSAMHRLPGDEVFHFYLGDPVEMLQLDPGGNGRLVLLGPDLGGGMHPQVLVPGGTWQGSRIVEGGRFALLGTTMAPGFEFQDLELGDGAELTAAYPAFATQIATRTRSR